jgi:16S rRNA (guanine527-N7)-methyltransferase
VFHVEHESPDPARRCEAALSRTESDEVAQEPETSAESAPDLLQRGLDELGFAPNTAQFEALLTLVSELERWSQRMNLTAHRSPAAIVRHLVLGAAGLATQVPPLASLADIGSGAGFPGLPFAVLRPDLRVTLVEPRRKRHHFQRAVVRAMGLRNVDMRLGRAEDLEATPHAAAVAQAVARPDQAIRWMLPWVERGGLVLLPAADDAPTPPHSDEISFDNKALRYRVPCGGPARALWIGRRG